MDRLVLITLLLVNAPAAFAQKYEVGVQVSGMHLHKIDESPLGMGARFHYNVTSIAAADLELTHYPENPSGNFGETTALFGLRIGPRPGSVGIFAKVRPGFIHFGGDYFNSRLDDKTHFILDTGVVLEYYWNRHIVLRMDYGDLTIYYGSARLFMNPNALGTVHNFQPGVGLAVRF
jgi:Outer membrane protein beta-barrel domain